MKLVQLNIEGFRAYQAPVAIRIDELTTIVGKNDAGKSTILEALEIFFNNKTVKIDSDDGCKVGDVDQKKIRIGCVFADLPDQIVLDTLSSITFAAAATRERSVGPRTTSGIRASWVTSRPV